MHRRRLAALGLAAALVLPGPFVLPGCGGASNIEIGVPANVEPPKDFDPGGGAVPNMSGRKAAEKKASEKANARPAP